MKPTVLSVLLGILCLGIGVAECPLLMIMAWGGPLYFWLTALSLVLLGSVVIAIVIEDYGALPFAQTF